MRGALLFRAVRVVDHNLEDVAPGEIGEILYSGPNVMQGYWQRPRETSAALLANGWLRTADAARIGVDRRVRMVGRMLDTLVLGGRLLHPGPLEARIVAKLSVADCAVVQEAAEAAPVAFVVARLGQPLDTTRVGQICREERTAKSTSEKCHHLAQAFERRASQLQPRKRSDESTSKSSHRRRREARIRARAGGVRP